MWRWETRGSWRAGCMPMTSIWTWSWERLRRYRFFFSYFSQVEETVTVIEIDEETYEEVKRKMKMNMIVFCHPHHDCHRCTNQPRETFRCCLCAAMESSWFLLPCALLARKTLPPSANSWWSKLSFGIVLFGMLSVIWDAEPKGWRVSVGIS